MKAKILSLLLAVVIIFITIAVVLHFNREALFPDTQIEQPEEPGDVEQPEEPSEPGIVLDQDYIYF